MTLHQDWEGQGIIAQILNEQLAAELALYETPVVNVSGIELRGVDFPRVAIDFNASAGLAVEHFLVRGFRRCAYVGPLERQCVKRHADAFQDRLASSSISLERFDYDHESQPTEGRPQQRQRLEDWLDGLEKPVGILSWGTAASCQLLYACRSKNIVVPYEVAVLAGENDEVISQTTLPVLSGVNNPSLQIGYRGAERLDCLIRGQRNDSSDERIPPLEIVTRGSTDLMALDDDELASAVRFMRNNALNELTVQQVADSVPMTRRSLERKFKAWVNRTPFAEIRRLRIVRVKELLSSTDLPMSKVADATGFGNPDYMSTVFKGELNMSPMQYRSMTRSKSLGFAQNDMIVGGAFDCQ